MIMTEYARGLLSGMLLVSAAAALLFAWSMRQSYRDALRIRTESQKLFELCDQIASENMRLKADHLSLQMQQTAIEQLRGRPPEPPPPPRSFHGPC